MGRLKGARVVAALTAPLRLLLRKGAVKSFDF